jgi:hypothetical protein
VSHFNSKHRIIETKEGKFLILIIAKDFLKNVAISRTKSIINIIKVGDFIYSQGRRFALLNH